MIDRTILQELSEKLVSIPSNPIESMRQNLHMYLNHMTIQELSELTDVPMSTMKNGIYGDVKDVKLTTAIKIASALGLTVDELCGCSTIEPQTKRAIQLARQLPPAYVGFLQWCVEYQYDMLQKNKDLSASIPCFTTVETETGNLRIENVYRTIDISDMPLNIKNKAFLGIKIANNLQAPFYFKGDTLIIANDRENRLTEHVVVCIEDNMWIVQKKDDLLVSIRDGKTKDMTVEKVLGYVAYIKRN